MAIVKASFTTHRQGAKATVKYITHRPGREGATITRALFGRDGVMSKQEVYRLIDEAGKGSLFFRLVVSPDPKREDTHHDLHLREVTEKTIQTLEERLHTPVSWVASVHNDHTPHRHVHALVVVQGRLHAHDLQALRQEATQACLRQRQERDLLREQQQREQERKDREEEQWER
jgi:hypothetical protein